PSESQFSPEKLRRLCHAIMVLKHSCLLFFQAEDGIRDWSVTGVQTCALPIYTSFFQAEDGIRDWSVTGVQTCALPISIKRLGLALANFKLILLKNFLTI